MTRIRLLSAACFMATLAAGTMAQSAPAASMPIAGHMVARDCGKPLARHDHGAERGSPSPKAKAVPCEPSATAAPPSTAASAPGKRPKHDHGRFHKNS